MLGVLAIIAVLTTGGIAGYSKAMSMWRINKSISEYNYFITGLLEYKDSLIRNADTSNKEFSIITFAQAANLIPNTWQQISGTFITDSSGYKIKPYVNVSDNRIVIDIYMTTSQTATSSTQTMQFCTKLFTNLTIPLADTIRGNFTWSNDASYTSTLYYGNKYCGSSEDTPCLRDISLSEIQKMCSGCVTSTGNMCGFIFSFE